MATIARLVTVIEAQTKGFEVVNTTLTNIEKNIGSIGTVAKTVGGVLSGAFTASAVIGYAKEIAEFASDMNDLSAQTGVTAQRLQAFNYIGAAAGVTVEDLASGVSQLSKRLVGEDKSAVRAIEYLRLNTQQLIDLAPDEAFIEIAEAVSRIPNPMERSAIMMELFGKNGTKYLRIASEDMRNLVTEAEKSSSIIPQETIDRAAALDGKMKELWITSKAVVATLGGEIVKAFSTVDLGDRSNALAMMQAAEKSAKGLGDVQLNVAKSTEAVAVATEKSTQSYADYIKEQEAAAERAKKLAKAQEEAARAAEKMKQQYAALQSEARNAEGIAKMNADLALMNATTSEATTKLLALAASWQVAFENHSELTNGLIYGTEAIKSQNTFIGSNIDQQIQATRASMAWRDQMDALADSFLTFAQIAGDSMSKTLRLIGSVVAGVGLAKDGVTSLKSGFASLGSGQILQGLTGIIGGIGGIAAAASAAVSLVTSLWHGLQRLFGGGEEGVVVNPARDKFFAQFVDMYGLSPFDSLAHAFGDAGVAGDVAERMIRTLYDAESMDAFRPAAQAIVDILNSGGIPARMNFHTGGMVPGVGEVPAMLLGGERVQSREEVADWRLMARAIDELPSRIARAVADAAVTAPRTRTA